MHERKDPWSVGAWMTPDPETITPSVSVRSAFVRMRMGGFRHLIVVDGGKIVGIVTDRDLRRPDISPEPEGWHDFYNLEEGYEVRHVMTLRVETVRPQDRLEKAVKILQERKFGALPVVDKNQQVIGILTTYGALQALSTLLAEVKQAERRSQAAAVVAG